MNKLNKYIKLFFMVLLSYSVVFSQDEEENLLVVMGNNPILTMNDILYNPMYNLAGIDNRAYSFESNLKLETPKSTSTSLIIDFDNKSASIETAFKGEESALYSYSYGELYSFIKDYGDLQMQKMWNSTFASSGDGSDSKGGRRGGYTIDWSNKGRQNFLNIFGGGKTKIDIELGGSVGVDFTKMTTNVSNSYDAGLQSDIQFDFNSKFGLQLGERARANVEFATAQSGEFTATGDNIVAEFIYKGTDSLDLEDNILQEVHAGWNIDMSFQSLDLVKTNFLNNSHGIKVRTKFGFIDMNTVVAVAESPTKSATEKGSSSSNILESYNYDEDVYFFLDSTFSKGFVWGENNSTTESPIEKNTFELYMSISNNDNNYRVEANGDPIFSYYMEFINGQYRKVPLPVKFIRIKPEYYTLNSKDGYVKIDKTLAYKLDGERLAVYYKRQDGSYDANYLTGKPSVGNGDNNMLKLIRPDDTDVAADHPYRLYYRWTNVYPLDMLNIDDISNIKVNIYRTDDNGNKIENHANGKKYSKNLQITDDKGVVDKIYVDADREYLIFPQKRPFDDLSSIEEAYLAPKIYDSIPSVTKNIFSIDIQGGQSYIKLSNAPVVSGSERIEAGGSVLKKGTDYTIDYISGEITLLSASAIANAENLTIEYNYQELFSLSTQLTVANHIGINLSNIDQKFGQRSSLNFLWLWHSESYDTDDNKVEIGQEPFSNTALGANLKLGYDIPILTKLINHIPGVETDAMSTIDVGGEFVRIIPDPLSGSDEVLVDNFENSAQIFPLSLSYENWQFSSEPLDSTIGTRADSSYWYTNNYKQYYKSDIWENWDGDIGDDALTPMEIHVVSTDTNQWMGFTQYVDISDINNYNYIDIWMRVVPDVGNATPGIVHIDLGDISEDIDGDGTLNFEGERDDFDHNINSKYDIGLDMLTDAEEKALGIDHTLDNNISVDNESDSERKGAYRKINQTQGNGKRDSEDLDKNQQLNISNNYYSYSIDMSKQSNDSIFTSSAKNGWRRFRIPLTLDTTLSIFKGKRVGLVPEKRINYMRFWIEQPDIGETKYQIATLEIRGNNWEATIGNEQDFNPILSTEDVFITTINNYEDAGYISPIPDDEDRDGNLIKEESIRLNFIEIEPGHEANITKEASVDPWDFINYDSIAFYAKPDEANDYDYAYIRMFTGAGSDENYYEVGFPLRNDLSNGSWTNIAIPVDTLLEAKRKSMQGQGSVFSHGEYVIKIMGTPVISSINKIVLGVKNNTIRPMSGAIDFNELRLVGVEKNPGNKFEVNGAVNFADLLSTSSKFSFKDNFYHEVDERFGNNNSTMRGNVSNTLNLEKFKLEKYGFKIPVTAGLSRSISRPSYYGDVKLSNDDLGDLWEDFSKNTGRGFDATKSEEFQELNNNKSFGVSLSKTRQKERKLKEYVNPLNIIDEFVFIRSSYQYGYSHADNLSISIEDTVKTNVGSWDWDLSRKGKLYRFTKDNKKTNFLQIRKDVGFNTSFNFDIEQSFSYKNKNYKNKSVIADEDDDDFEEDEEDSTFNEFIRNREVTLDQNISASYNLLNVIPISWGVSIDKDISEDVDSAYSQKTGNAATEILSKSIKMMNSDKIDGIFYNEKSHSQNFSMAFNPNLLSFLKTTSKYQSTFDQSFYGKDYVSDSTEADSNQIFSELDTINSLDIVHNNELDLGLSLDIIKIFSMNNKWRKMTQLLRKNKVKAITFNYKRKETQNIYNVDESEYGFDNYGLLTGYQHGLTKDTRLFSDEKSRYFYSDTTSANTKKVTENEYKYSTGFMPYNPLVIKYSPVFANTKEEYIKDIDNRTTEEFSPLNLSWNVNNYKKLSRMFKRTSFNGSFKRKYSNEYNYDSTIVTNAIDNSWKIISTDLSFRNNNWSISSQISYDWLNDSTVYKEEKDDGSWRYKTVMNFMIKPSYSKSLNYFLNIRGKKLKIDKVELGIPFSYTSKYEEMKSNNTPEETRSYELQPEAKAYMWKNRIVTRAYISWSRNSDLQDDTQEDFWRFGLFFQVNFKTSK